MTINQDLDKQRRALTRERVKEDINQLLDKEPNVSVSSDTIDEIRNVLRGISPWAGPKQQGLLHFTGSSLTSVKEVVGSLTETGVFPVPCGEMESFAREYRSNSCKGAKWLSKVFENEDLKTSPALREARDFVKEVYGWISSPKHSPGESSDKSS